MRRVALTALTLLGAAALTAEPAMAAWTSSSAGTGKVGAHTLPAGARPSATLSGTTITITLPTVTYTGSTRTVTAFAVVRYPKNSSTGTFVCGTSVTGTPVTVSGSCTDSPPAGGDWQYTEIPVAGNWVGTEGNKSTPSVRN